MAQLTVHQGGESVSQMLLRAGQGPLCGIRP
jgi:hypothetical protein